MMKNASYLKRPAFAGDFDRRRIVQPGEHRSAVLFAGHFHKVVKQELSRPGLADELRGQRGAHMAPLFGKLAVLLTKRRLQHDEIRAGAEFRESLRVGGVPRADC